jgi:hypothetical protein
MRDTDMPDAIPQTGASRNRHNPNVCVKVKAIVIRARKQERKRVSRNKIRKDQKNSCIEVSECLFVSLVEIGRSGYADNRRAPESEYHHTCVRQAKVLSFNSS